MKFLHGRSKTITSAAFLLVIAALASRFLGLIRDRILAGKFGAGDELDIYFTAFRVPDLLYNMVIAGAISSAFIPVFVSLYAKNKEEAWRAANNFLNISVAVFLVLGVIFILAAPVLVPYISPGFNDEKMSITVTATRIMFLSPLFLGISAIFGGILHSSKRFFIYAFAPILYNLGIIFGAVFLAEPFGVYGLAIGVVIGSFAHFIFQIPSVLLSGFSWQGIFDFKDRHFQKIFFLMIPRSLGLVIFQLNLWIITAIASVLPVGSVSIFNLANHFQFLAIGIIGYSFSTAAMPSFAESVSRERMKSFGEQLSKTIRMTLFFVLPISVLMFVLRAHIVRLVLGSGGFTWDDTRLTAAALGVFCFGIFAHSLIPTFSKAFYAMQNTKTPVLINSVGFFINIGLSLFFVFVLFKDPQMSGFVSRFLDIEGIENIALLGLPLAFAISGIINLKLLALALGRTMKDFMFIAVWLEGIKMLLASILSGLISYITLYVAEPFFDTRTVLGLFLQASSAALAGGAVYLVFMLLLRSSELVAFSKFFHRKLSRYPHEYHVNGKGNL